MDYKLGRTKAPPVDESVVVSPLVSLIMRLMIDQVRSLNNVFLLPSSVAIKESTKIWLPLPKKCLLGSISCCILPQRLLLRTTVGGFIFCCTRVNLLKNHAQITPKYNQYQAYSRRPSVQLETDRPGVEAIR